MHDLNFVYLGWDLRFCRFLFDPLEAFQDVPVVSARAAWSPTCNRFWHEKVCVPCIGSLFEMSWSVPSLWEKNGISGLKWENSIANLHIRPDLTRWSKPWLWNISHAAILRSHWCRHSGSRWRLLRVSKLQFSHVGREVGWRNCLLSEERKRPMYVQPITG